MKVKTTEKLREVETLYKRIESFAPTNDVARKTRQLLLELARTRRTELRRERLSVCSDLGMVPALKAGRVSIA
jgi:hypothetical protein